VAAVSYLSADDIHDVPKRRDITVSRNLTMHIVLVPCSDEWPQERDQIRAGARHSSCPWSEIIETDAMIEEESNDKAVA
jgi:hypothetical protein